MNALRRGDHLLIIPFQRRQSLYDLVIGRVHGHPAIQLHLALIAKWHTELIRGLHEWSRDELLSRHGSARSEALLAEIRKRGSRLSSGLAVKFWITRATLCPSDPEDIRRVAEVLGLDWIKDNYRKISQAAIRIRGLHRGLANRLNHWLSDRARGLVDSHDSEIVDQETQLTFGDLRASFLVVEVLHATSIQGPFLRATLGMISKGGQREASLSA